MECMGCSLLCKTKYTTCHNLFWHVPTACLKWTAGATVGVAFTGLTNLSKAISGYTPGAAWCCPPLRGAKMMTLGQSRPRKTVKVASESRELCTCLLFCARARPGQKAAVSPLATASSTRQRSARFCTLLRALVGVCRMQCRRGGRGPGGSSRQGTHEQHPQRFSDSAAVDRRRQRGRHAGRSLADEHCCQHSSCGKGPSVASIDCVARGRVGMSKLWAN